MTTPIPTRRRFCPTPGWLILALLVVECLLWLSNWAGCPVWHKGYAVLVALAGVGVVLLVMLLWLVVALVSRWWFQFCIRSLLLLVVAVALPFSWLAVERTKAREQKNVVETIRKLDDDVIYDFQFANTGLPKPPVWLNDTFGDDFFAEVICVSLQHTKDTDTALEQIKDLTTVEVLNISDTKVTDTGLAHVAGFTQLQWLSLEGTQVTDAGLESLKGLCRLEDLHLKGTKVTDAGVKKLQAALPNCKITR